MEEKIKKGKIKKGKTKKYGITFRTYRKQETEHRKQRTENRKETEIETRQIKRQKNVPL